MSVLFATNPRYRGQLGSGQWTLCVGAGISRGIIPTWNELTRRVVNYSFSTNYLLTEFNEIVLQTGWGLDGWIQAAANKHKHSGGTPEEFNNLLENILYGDLKDKAKSEGLEKEIVIALNDPRNISKDNVFLSCDFFERNYSDTSLLSIAKSLINTEKDPGKLPNSIITFNADTLLHTVIELFQRKFHYLSPLPHSHPKYWYKTVMRSIGGVPKRKIPIFHCHGAIKPKTAVKGPHRYDSRDKLIFLEQEYLQLATSASAWPETVFMFNAQANRMVFVGLSMADPNIRRWMAAANQLYRGDLEIVAKTLNVVPKHIWLTTTSIDKSLDEIKQVALDHLGIRPAWIDKWQDLETALNNLIGS